MELVNRARTINVTIESCRIQVAVTSSANVSKSGKFRQGPEHLPRPRESFQDDQSGWTNYQGLISSLCSSRKAFLGLGRVSLTAGCLVRHYNSGASLYGDQCLMACVYQWTTSLTVTNTSQVSKVILVEFIDHVLPVLCSEHVFVIIDFLVLHPHSRLGQGKTHPSHRQLCVRITNLERPPSESADTPSSQPLTLHDHANPSAEALIPSLPHTHLIAVTLFLSSRSGACQ